MNTKTSCRSQFFILVILLSLIGVKIVNADAASGDARVESEFLDALSALNQGHYQIAIDKLAALVKQSSAPRIRLELARALTFVGRDDAARVLFIGVYEEDPPPDVKAMILRFIDDIDLRRGKFSFGLRGERASNPLNEPTSSVFQFAGQLLTNSSESRYQNSFGVVYFGRYDKQISPLFDVRSAASFRDLPGTLGDLTSGDISFGFHPDGSPVETRAGIEFAQMTDRSFAMPYLEASYQFALTDRLKLQPRLQLGDLRHEGGFGSSGQNYRVSLPIVYALSPARKLVTGPQTEIRRVGFEELGYHSIGWTFEADFSFPQLSVATVIFPSFTEFNAVDPFWDTRRRDENIRASIEISSDRIRYKGIMPTLNVSCEQTHSSIDYYTTNNCTAGLGLQQIF